MFLPNLILKVKENEKKSKYTRKMVRLWKWPVSLWPVALLWHTAAIKNSSHKSRWSFQSVLRLNASLSRTVWGVDSVCFGTMYFYPGWQEKRKNLCTHTHTRTTLIKCEDELDSGLVRGTLLMLIRGLGGYPSRWSRGGKSQCQGRTWQRHFVSRLNKVRSALYVKQKTRKNTAV